MKLKEYKKALDEFIKNNPKALEMNVFYASDDEGNDYHEVFNCPVILPVDFLLDSGVTINHLGDNTSEVVCIN